MLTQNLKYNQLFLGPLNSEFLCNDINYSSLKTNPC